MFTSIASFMLSFWFTFSGFLSLRWSHNKNRTKIELDININTLNAKIKKYKIPLNHHDALSDANACAELYLKHLRRQALPKTGSLF